MANFLLFRGRKTKHTEKSDIKRTEKQAKKKHFLFIIILFSSWFSFGFACSLRLRCCSFFVVAVVVWNNSHSMLFISPNFFLPSSQFLQLMVGVRFFLITFRFLSSFRLVVFFVFFLCSPVLSLSPLFYLFFQLEFGQRRFFPIICIHLHTFA